MVSKGADVNKECCRLTSLNCDIGDTDDENSHPNAAWFASKRRAVIDYLILAGADINGRGTSPLYSATTSNNLEMVKYFAALGADVNRGNNSSYPLQIAAIEGFLEVAKILLKYGAALVSKHGELALRDAIASSYLPMVELLVSHGATLGGESVHSFVRWEYKCYTAVYRFLLSEFS